MIKLTSSNQKIEPWDIVRIGYKIRDDAFKRDSLVLYQEGDLPRFIGQISEHFNQVVLQLWNGQIILVRPKNVQA